MEETPVQIRVLTDGRPSGRLFHADWRWRMPLEKPAAVAADPVKSAKWDELTAGRSFTQSDAPTLALLCQWYKIVQLARDELDSFGEQTAYQNDMGDLKSFPQIATLKTASAEIRQLNKQLGITDGHEGAPDVRNVQTKLFSIAERHEARKARAAV